MIFKKSQSFEEYEKQIVNDPAYAGMPDVYFDDGSIQWEAPSNRGSGKFKDTHDRRLQWWIKKAAEVGVSTSENHWISKVAKMIHPTKKRPCKICGRIMDIRYVYLSLNLIKRIEEAFPGIQELMPLDECTDIHDVVSFLLETYPGSNKSICGLLRCKGFEKINDYGPDYAKWCVFLDDLYIPAEPSLLGPGAMSNPPDRLDGFHSFNRCCRKTKDKGRSKENLASYSKDRRAFEFWSDGNWIEANMLMAAVKTDPGLSREVCANFGDGQVHPLPCDADHIGPISLGFCHRPVFQFLCSSCNSSKNNRMSLSDIKQLISAESAGETVVSWYAKSVWDLCKGRVADDNGARQLSKVMRDNRDLALTTLYEIMKMGGYAFLLTLLNLDLANYKYCLVSKTVKGHVVRGSFNRTDGSNLLYAVDQKVRKIRVAFQSLQDYSDKDNRNGYQFTSPAIEKKKKDLFAAIKAVVSAFPDANEYLASIAEGPESQMNESYKAFFDDIDYSEIERSQETKAARMRLLELMDLFAEHLSGNWMSDRYVRP